MTSEIADSVERTVRSCAADAPALYAALLRDGWATAGIPEAAGGSGGGLADAVEVVAALAGAGVGLPVADTTIIAAQLLALSGLRLPEAARCVVPLCAGDGVLPGEVVTAHARRVPWASWASHLVLACPAGSAGTAVAVVRSAAATIIRGANLAAEPRDDVRLSAVPAAAVVTIQRSYPDVAGEVRAAGALARSIQMAAVIARVLDMTSRYCSERVQFGKPIAAQQAVQQQLADLAAQNAAARAAVAAGLAAVADAGAGSLTGAMTEIAMAKARTSQAAGAAARIAHQLHGAIGVTREYPLQRYSRALWSWREEYGTQGYWSQWLADRLADHAADLWGWLTARELAKSSS